MTVYPAIDLRGGRCVRLLQGAFERETVYGDDPVAVARGLEAAAARDGTERGPDLEWTSAIARAAGVPVIASGGIGSLDDVRAVAARAADGVAGMIIGRALYTGAIRLEDALAAAGDR